MSRSRAGELLRGRLAGKRASGATAVVAVKSPADAKTYKVALLIETSNRYGRDLLYGVRDWTRAGERWAIRFSEQARLAPLPAWLQQWAGDGIIARVDSPEIARALRRTGLPVVDVSAERFASEFPRVSVDNVAVAQLAAEHLLGKGFRHCAFFGDSQYLWARQRGEEFRAAVLKAGRSCAVYPRGRSREKRPGSDEEITAMADWLATLPRPLGVFACYDGRAQQVLEACQSRHWAVPEAIAVLGVDNDDVLCELCTPPLSSVQPNARRTGYEAAAMLARMMQGERPGRRTRFVAPVRVVERPSTDVVAVADARVAQALRYIREHVGEGIDVSDVRRAVPMSRTLLERKFKKALGHSPHRQIVQQRIERAKHFLAESEVSIAVVADLAGFADASYLSVAFRRETGESPYAYRAQQRTGR
ncbi:MAG: Xylose operon regulatory protein [Verrucomicrobiota bacterium]|jgi:LacI family transcriptional regulator